MTTSTDPSVSILAHHTLRCSDDNACQAFDSPTIKLGPFDQLVSFLIPVVVIFVYEAGKTELSIPIARLQRASELLLDYYPHLTGRLQIESDGTYEIARLGAGAELLVAQCGEPLNVSGPISLFELPGSGNALLPPFEPTLEDACSNPLFTIQHTRFACGSVALGIRLRHCNCDADGYFQFVSHLAELYRGLDKNTLPKLAHPPHIRSYMSDLGEMTMAERQETLAFQPSLLRLAPISSESAVAASATSEHSSPVIGRIIRFSGKGLETLKAYATDQNDGDSWVSTFEALSALLYQCIYQARLQYVGGNPSLLPPPGFLTPVNFRGPDRLSDFPSRYFGNALLCLCTTLSHDLLAHAPLWQVGKHLHELIRGGVPDELHVKKTLRWIDAQPDKSRIRINTESLMVMLSQWHKFDMYTSTVFDETPLLASTTFTSISLIDGLGYTLPSDKHIQKGDKDAIDVNMALSKPTWEILERNELLQRFARIIE